MSSILLFAELRGPSLYLALMFVMMMLIMLSMCMLFMKYYVRCPSNRVLVIYGKTVRGDKPICVRAGARLVQPLIQDYAWLSLEPIQVEVPLRGIPSADHIRVDVRIVLTVAIGTSQELMDNAAARLLGLGPADVAKTLLDIATGQFRHVIASMRVEEIIHDRPRFLELVDEWMPHDLAKLGLAVVNVTITDIDAEGGYLDTLGKKAAAEASLGRLLDDNFEGSATRLIGSLIQEGRLSKTDHAEVRQLLDAQEADAT
jgi:flotillin